MQEVRLRHLLQIAFKLLQQAFVPAIIIDIVINKHRHGNSMQDFQETKNDAFYEKGGQRRQLISTAFRRNGWRRFLRRGKREFCIFNYTWKQHGLFHINFRVKFKIN